MEKMKKIDSELRQATELEDAKDLNLSREALEEIKRMRLSPEALVLHGRSLALGYDKNPKKKKQDLPINVKLVNALDEAGYIRHDLSPATCIVWRLYHEIQSDITIKRICYSNEQYETMKAVTDKEHRQVVQTVMSLPEPEGKVLLGLYALEGGTKQSHAKIARTLDCTPEEVKKYETRALRDLRKPEYLIKLPEILGWENRRLPNLNLYKGKEKATEETKLDELYWESGTTYQTLIESQVYNLGDILKLPKADWNRIKQDNPKVLENTEEVMHEMGFLDFATS